MAKDSKNDSNLIIRISKEDRDDFVLACEQAGTSASEELRKHIKKYVKKRQKIDADAQNDAAETKK